MGCTKKRAESANDGVLPKFFHHGIHKAFTYSSVKSRWKTVDNKLLSDPNREELHFPGFSIFGRLEIFNRLSLKIEIENRKKPSIVLLKIVHSIDCRVV